VSPVLDSVIDLTVAVTFLVAEKADTEVTAKNKNMENFIDRLYEV
jgi:hypothetical protein